MTSGYFLKFWKKKLEFEKHFEISKKIGNFDKILKFVKQLWNLEIFGNLGKNWKFGKNFEIWLTIGNWEKI